MSVLLVAFYMFGVQILALSLLLLQFQLNQFQQAQGGYKSRRNRWR
jgi:hypothetical protein